MLDSPWQALYSTPKPIVLKGVILREYIMKIQISLGKIWHMVSVSFCITHAGTRKSQLFMNQSKIPSFGGCKGRLLTDSRHKCVWVFSPLTEPSPRPWISLWERERKKIVSKRKRLQRGEGRGTSERGEKERGRGEGAIPKMHYTFLICLDIYSMFLMVGFCSLAMFMWRHFITFLYVMDIGREMLAL